MIILGISPLDKDATVTLAVDGLVTQSMAEERFSRKKMHAGFPYLALQEVLDAEGITADDIDHVVYSFLDAKQEATLMRANMAADNELNRQRGPRSTMTLIREASEKVPKRSNSIPGLKSAAEKMTKPWYKRQLYKLAASDGPIGAWMNRRQFEDWLQTATVDHQQYQSELTKGLSKFGLLEKLERVEHHRTHAANAYYCSGFDEALIVTIDAYGSGLSGSVNIGRGTTIERIADVKTPYSLGAFYEQVTSALGYSPDRHAGKIVGLAAYGDPEVLGDVLRNHVSWEDGVFQIRRSMDVYLSRYLSCLFPKIDLAAAYQTVLEEIVCKQVEHFVRTTAIGKVVLSGGVAANVKMNQRIHEVAGVESVYVHPGMGDGGCGLGAALLKSVELGATPRRLENAYLGPEFSDKQIEQELRSAGCKFERFERIEPEIARLIASDRVVARFNGRMEYGPRALGNRSILYPATDPKVNQWLNHRLGRTEFMPFAPATLDEDRDKYYIGMEGTEFTSQFMTITFQCTPEMIEKCPAAVHIDGTARPQLVSEQSNSSFYQIIQEYKKLTGIGSVINTSFNMHEEPIVCTPADAIRAFQLGRLDYLAIGNFLVASDSLNGSPENERQPADIEVV